MRFLAPLNNLWFIAADSYDAFASSADDTTYDGLDGVASNTLVGLFHIIQDAGVYLGALAIVVGAIVLIVNSGNSKAAGEAKSNLVGTIGIMILIFGVVDIVSMIVTASL